MSFGERNFKLHVVEKEQVVQSQLKKGVPTIKEEDKQYNSAVKDSYLKDLFG